MMNILGWPLGWIMFFCYTLVRNYGLALILFTLLTKLALLPLAIKQQKGMAKMAILKPKMDEIQRKYAKNPQKQQEEMQALYSQENYNPMAGCLPTLIQFPILFGMINVIYYPLKHILRIPADVTAKAAEIMTGFLDPSKISAYSQEISVIKAFKENPGAFSSMGEDFVNKLSNFDFTFFGLDLSAIPAFSFKSTQEVLLFLIPVLSGVSAVIMSLLTTKMTGSDTQTKGANLMTTLMMPIFSVYIGFRVPAGVGIYWLLSNVFATIQQVVLFKLYNPQKMAAEAQAEAEAAKIREKEERAAARKRLQDQLNIPEEERENTISQKELDRLKLAAARKRDAEKYGEEYTDVSDDELE